MRIDITSRQKQILDYLARVDAAGVQEILDYLLENDLADVSRPTINRDIEELSEIELIISQGSGPSTKYTVTAKAKLLTIIDPVAYFKIPPDERNSYLTFNWQIFDLLDQTQIFSDNELQQLAELQEEYLAQKSKLSPTLLHKEIERVTIELSWKSSQIEGNTYSLLETEELIKNGNPASDKSPAESQMILNHKNTINYIFDNVGEFEKLSVVQIENLHALLVKGLNIIGGIRKTLVGITGTVYRPLDNEHQIREALEKSVDLLNNTENTFTKAFLLILLLSYLQPFEDGNKRTSRILGNAVLLAGGAFPLSFRSVDEVNYKESMLLFYEQNNISLFKEIFLEQAQFAVRNYFRSSN